MIQMFGTSNTGCVRKNNEDRFRVDQRLGLCLLADGMGGHQHGEVAAELAVQTSYHFMTVSRDRFDITWPFGYALTEAWMRTGSSMPSNWRTAKSGTKSRSFPSAQVWVRH